jgi:hypothetical protein
LLEYFCESKISYLLHAQQFQDNYNNA